MIEADGESRSAEQNLIGTRNESSLHSDIKGWYALPGDKFEQPVGSYIVDIVRGDLLIEIQTGSFTAIRDKLRNLVRDHRVRLVYPIARRTWLVRVSKRGKRLSRRRSPKQGEILDLFKELIYMPNLVATGNLELEVLLLETEEARCDDGKGSRWRGGVSILDRRLLDVVRRIDFTGPGDFLRLLPEGLAQPFTNKDLAAALDIDADRARQMTYCLKNMGALEEVGRRGNALMFRMADSP